MNEGWVSTEAGRHLAGRKKRDTKPEVLLRKALHAQGARFRINKHLAKGCTPDILLPRRGLAIFVDGCFWHGCPEHGRKTPWTGPNAQLWEDKMRRNKERDLASSAAAAALGWEPVRVWECEVNASPEGAACKVLGRPVDGGPGQAPESPR